MEYFCVGIKYQDNAADIWQNDTNPHIPTIGAALLIAEHLLQDDKIASCSIITFTGDTTVNLYKLTRG